MQDTILVSILPYAVMGGIVASALASIALVVGTFLKSRRENGSVFEKLEELEAAIRRDTNRIDTQLAQSAHGITSDRARIVVSDLSLIADDLQKRAGEVHRILEDLRPDSGVSDTIENTKKFVSLGILVGQTETQLDAVVKRIQRQRDELEDFQVSEVTRQG